MEDTKVKKIARLKEIVDKVKSGPCSDCGNKFNPWQMDLDHRPGTNKILRISKMVSDACGFNNLKKEIAKCDLVCANCHRQRTHIRGYTNSSKDRKPVDGYVGGLRKPHPIVQAFCLNCTKRFSRRKARNLPKFCTTSCSTSFNNKIRYTQSKPSPDYIG